MQANALRQGIRKGIRQGLRTALRTGARGIDRLLDSGGRPISLKARVLDVLGARPPQAGTTTVRDDRFAYHFVCHSEKERRRARRMLDKEVGTIAWLTRELRPDDVFFDVGANIGVYTIFAARRLGAGGTVVAFEPHIPNAGSLIENIVLNQQQERVLLVTSALTNGERFNNFNYQSIRAASSISQFGAPSYEGNAFRPAFVEIKHGCTLDMLCGRGVLPRPTLVKIDVDGLDCEVLEGMTGLLASSDRPRSIQVELGTDSKARVMALMARANYALREKHWTQAGLAHIALGNDPESHPHYGIFERKPSAGQN